MQAGWTVGDRHPRLWCAWGTSASCTFCPIDCARRMRKKLQPCAWCHVAKVGPTDPASCVRCYISVLRLETDPNPPNFCWVNIGGVIIKLSADPLSEAPIDERDMFDYRRPYVELWTLTATCHQCAHRAPKSGRPPRAPQAGVVVPDGPACTSPPPCIMLACLARHER